MKSIRKRLKPRFTTARNDRRTVYKYYPVDENKSVAVKGGRCHRCQEITTEFCFNCGRFACERHLAKTSDTAFCLDCKQKSNKASYIW